MEARSKNSSGMYAKLLIAGFILYSDCIITWKWKMEYYRNSIQVLHEDRLQSEKDSFLTLSLPFLFKIASHSILLFVTVASITQQQVRKDFARVWVSKMLPREAGEDVKYQSAASWRTLIQWGIICPDFATGLCWGGSRGVLRIVQSIWVLWFPVDRKKKKKKECCLFYE